MRSCFIYPFTAKERHLIRSRKFTLSTKRISQGGENVMYNKQKSPTESDLNDFWSMMRGV